MHTLELLADPGQEAVIEMLEVSLEQRQTPHTFP